MKIFYNASLTGKSEYLEYYELINAAIEKSGHEILAAPVMKKTVEAVIKESTKEAGDYAQKLQKWIKQADVCIFEVSYPSTSIGYEVALALTNAKPVVALHVHDAPVNSVLESIKDDKLQLIDYRVHEIEGLVADAIEYAGEQMDTRFNFFISPEIGNYLDWVAKERKLPRAVFLRQLIEEDMADQGYDS